VSPILGIVASQNYPRSISVEYLVIAGGGTNLTYTEPTRSGYRVYQITASSAGTITF
jgi:hypothetical protein